MQTFLFDFDLPDERIALRPVAPRDRARLLVVRPPSPMTSPGFVSAPVLENRHVVDLPDLLEPGDALVVNDTKVIPAALEGLRTRGEAKARVAFNLIRRVDASRWRALARPTKRLAVGDRITFGSDSGVCLLSELNARITFKGDGGEVELEFPLHGAYLDEAIALHGAMPLPPYITMKRAPDASDRADYQTMFAAREGAVAAPTASLHFTPALVEALTARGVERLTTTLHVGAGTFLPVKAADTDDHQMHAEWGEIRAETADALNGVRSRGGRIVAAGSTALRLLESAVDVDGRIKPFCGETALFITPGYRFRAVDVLLTNFHLPRSTLFMLVSAFAGLDTMRQAYTAAIQGDYRFYSYGDACLLFRAP